MQLVVNAFLASFVIMGIINLMIAMWELVLSNEDPDTDPDDVPPIPPGDYAVDDWRTGDS